MENFSMICKSSALYTLATPTVFYQEQTESEYDWHLGVFRNALGSGRLMANN